MTTSKEELKRVAREQLDLYDAMVRSIWGDRMTLALTAAALGGFGLGLLFNKRWIARYLGALCYGAAAGMELYAAMSTKQRAARPTPIAEARAA